MKFPPQTHFCNNLTLCTVTRPQYSLKQMIRIVTQKIMSLFYMILVTHTPGQYLQVTINFELWVLLIAL